MKKLKLEELGRMSAAEFRNAPKTPVIVLLDNIRSLHNVGSAFRTADAFRIEKIILTGITGQPPHREINKAALGATESVSWEYVEKGDTAIKQLKENNYQILCLEQTTESIPLNDFIPENGKKICLVFGNEVSGVTEEILKLADHILEVPQIGTKHSLNVSVSIGIVLWDLINKLKAF